MKKIVFTLAIVCSIKSYSQDSQKLHEIDSLVNVIRTSGFTTGHDSITNDYPDFGLFMKTYLTTITNEGQLKSFVNYVKSKRVEKGDTLESSGFNSFYFDQHKLIKVEEAVRHGADDVRFNWYYSDGKSLYHTSTNEGSEERAAQLLTMAYAMLKQIEK